MIALALSCSLSWDGPNTCEEGRNAGLLAYATPFLAGLDACLRRHDSYEQPMHNADIPPTRVLFTGASGAIGRSVATRLARMPNVALRLFARSMARLQDLSHVDVVTGDVRDRSSVAKAVRGVDIIIHAAAAVSSWVQPEPFWQTNVVGLQNLLDYALANHVHTIVHLSTITVYEESPDSTITEHTPYAQTSWPYAQTKIESEKLLLEGV